MSNKTYTIFISFIVALGGFLFGFDAGIISGVMSFAGPEFNLNEIQSGWVVSAPSFAAMFAMLFSGRLSDLFGRKKMLIFVAFLYAISAAISPKLANFFNKNQLKEMNILVKQVTLWLFIIGFVSMLFFVCFGRN